MTDRRTVLGVIVALTAVALVLAIALASTVVTGRHVDEAVLTLLAGQLGTAVGGLTAFLVHTGSTPPAEPVPVEAEPAEA